MDLEKIYSEGKSVSHQAGLAAVYEAGRKSMEPPPVEQALPQPEPIAAAPKKKASFVAPVAKTKKKRNR